MPTPASQLALNGLRDLTMLKWYVIPLLAIIFYIYTLAISMNVFGMGLMGWIY
ncbi:MAG: hypothetical protein WBM69_12295 [Desulfobacterales bacterium]